MHGRFQLSISTAQLFARVVVSHIKAHPDTKRLIKAISIGDVAAAAEKMGNVFEEVLPPECGAVFAIRDALLAAGALGAGMSGSGPTVFGIFREEGLARAAQEITLPLGESYTVGPLGKLTCPREMPRFPRNSLGKNFRKPV